MKQNVGFRIYKDFRRPDPELIQKFAGIPSSNIGDCLNRLYNMRSNLMPFNEAPLLGPAFTVKAPCGDNLVTQKALDLAKPGDIIVIDAEGCRDRSIFGEMMVNYAMMRGIGGFIVDGAIRDADAIRNMPIPVYAIAVTPQGPYKHGPGEINVPIACGGQVVRPGDILVGDMDGIVVIKPEWAEDLLPEAIKKRDTEAATLAKRAKATEEEKQEMFRKHVAKWEKTLADAGADYYDCWEGEALK